MKRYAPLLLLVLIISLSGCSSDEGPAAPNISAPSGLVAVPLSDNAVRLVWSDNSFNEAGFRVERSAAGAGGWAQAGEDQGPNTGSYTDVGLAEGSGYDYRVTAFTGGHLSDPTNTASVTTLPTAPSGLQAARASETQIDLSWSDLSAVETGFEIQRKAGARGEFAAIAELPANTAAFANTDLAPRTTFTYRVRATLDGSGSVWSNEASAVTTVLRPSAPINLRGEVISPNDIWLEWQSSANNEDGLIIQRSYTGMDNDWAHLDSLPPDRFNHTDRLLAPETIYFYRIFNYNQHGRSDFSNVVEVETPVGPPAPATELSANAPTYRAVNLAWVDNSTTENGFEIHRALPPSDFYSVIDSVGADVTAYTDSNVTRVKAYSYKLRAYGEGGRSSFSNVATVTTPDGPPNAPSRLSATALDLTTIRLNWLDNSTNETNFSIERRAADQERFREINILERNVSTYVDRDLDFETWYYYRVFSFNAIGGSNYSNIDSAQTWGLGIMSDGFEGYAVGATPPPASGWEARLNGNTRLTVSDRFANTGEKSLLFEDPAGSTDNSIVLLYEHRNSVNNHMSFAVYLPAYGRLFAIRGGNELGNIAWEIQLSDDGLMGVRSGGSWITRNDMPLDSWVRFDVYASTESDNYNVEMNGTLIAENAAFAQLSQYLGAIVFVSFSSVGNEDSPWPQLFLDDVSVTEVIPEGEGLPSDGGSPSAAGGTSVFDTGTRFGLPSTR